MAECCWYQTDISTLWRYAKNTIGYYVSHRRKIAAEISAGITTGADIDEPQSAA
jgi:hypothetical protein